MTSLCGTSYTMAPEIAAGTPYTEKCDVWSVGVLAFMCAVGFAPFCGESDEEIMSKVKHEEITFEKKAWERHNPALQPIVSMLLTRDPGERPGARHVTKSSDWLK